jgi:nucleotide-binding universal stress UspA family protein
MMRRVVLPLERCDDDAAAVAFAGVLSRRRRLEVLLLRIEEWPLIGPFGMSWALAWRAGDLDAVKKRLEGEEGIRAEILLPDAARPTAVMELAQRRAASLILLPYRHDGALMRMMHGSAADRILRESPIPVLAVPGPARPISRILYLFADGEAAMPGLRHVIDFAQLFDARVSLLRLQSPSAARAEENPLEKRLLSMLERREVSARLLTGPNDPVAAVSREGADLVILSKTQETARVCAALARRLLLLGPVPVLLTSEGPVRSPLTGAETPLRVGI